MIKRTKWDAVFSKYIRTRDNWTCQRCAKKLPQGSMGLHCSHFFGRAKYSTRFDFENCEALCYGCHQYLTSHPNEHRSHKVLKLGAERFNKLTLRSNQRAKRSQILSKENYDYLKQRLRKYREMNNGKGENAKPIN